MKKKSKDQRWRWICAGSLLLASLSGNLEASGLSHPDVNPMEVSQTVRKLRGTILDTNGTPVIGASISVKGTTTGTISDMNGVFTLDVKNGDILEISFIGYLSHTVKVGTQTDLQVVLKEDTQALDEVVVVGYGVQKKSVMTAAISRVTSDDLEKLTPTRVEDVLRGKVSGVSIMQNSGQPGAESRVRIRGTGTINDSNPLYIVDGMPLEGGVDYLNPQDIQSIEVLKDAASAAIYGSRAANGVILVTTKSGKKGKAVVNYDFSIGWQNPWRKMSVLNATEYETIMNEAYVNAGMDPIYDDPSKAGVGTNWQNEIYNENAPIMNHQASISGGGDKGSYFLSFGYLDQEGIVGGKDKSDYKRYSLRFNNTYNVFENKANKFFRSFKVGTNLGYTRIISKGISENDNFSGPLASAVMTPPNESVYLENPSAEDLAYYEKNYPGYVKDDEGRIYNVIENQEIVNPVAMMQTLNNNKDWDKFVGSVWGELEVFENLTFKTSLSTDMAFWGERNWFPVSYLIIKISVMNKYIYLLAVVFGLSGCNDFLELSPTNKVIETDYYKTQEDLTEALVAAYDPLKWNAYNAYSSYELVSNIMSDDAETGGSTVSDQPQLQRVNDFTNWVTPTNLPEGLWGRSYEGVNRANIVIEKCPLLPEGTMSEELRDRYVAEAHFLRVFYYFQLWRFFGYIPYYETNLGLDDITTVPQLQPDEVYAKLIEDLDNNVIGKLPKIVPANEKGRATNGAAIAMKARIVLYQNDDTKMKEIASQLKELITDPAYQYDLIPDYKVLFDDEYEWCKESVFEVNYTEIGNSNDWAGKANQGNSDIIMLGARGLKDPNNVYVEGWGFAPVTKALNDAFLPNDPRKWTTIIDHEEFRAEGGTVSSDVNQYTGYSVCKYHPRAGYSSTVGTEALNYKNNCRVIRFSDVLLMASEALLRSGGSVGEAQDYYARVVKRAMGDDYKVPVVSLDNIYKERRYEFAMEGIRYWDLVRTNQAKDFIKGWDDTKKYLPIPQSEIDKSDGHLVQNPHF
ncbi:SusC/RagA family TonB-linked outer membrane protein [Parabacteroides distasonis]|uniref:SusC/RagA family TonB-linked outer membrane protein n=2 Tax=Parabacteroides distasonis TaxID=823 RepID=A0AAW6FBH0_PARDI|nr:SusC/RagA family TonB-linked outer membrane protein [Parabacteroides distasonis]MDB9140571.1 SusC/RagA family TonB-linked outer membrane protein [Parabacteroides distasonis]MDB9145504.1 SusC/RagA family TonB-linked outer membrane protein [Parabacteroides distasonis]